VALRRRLERVAAFEVAAHLAGFARAKRVDELQKLGAEVAAAQAKLDACDIRISQGPDGHS
jgi:hypothetical protein